MATIGKSYPTLKDVYSQQDGEGKITSAIIELFIRNNPILEDAIAVECNDGTSHLTTVRNGLPEVQFRKFYQGVMPSKGDFTQIKDSTSMLDDYSVCDKKLADMSGNVNQFRLNESESHIQAMNNKVADTIFYGNKGIDDAAFDGLAVRYNKLSATKGDIGYQVIDAGGNGSDNTSIWFVTWGDNHTCLLYPKGSKAGIEHQDKGQITETKADGSKFEAYQDWYSWNVGMCIRNYRANCRVANIDVSNLKGATPTDLFEKLILGWHRVKKHAKGGKTVIYVNDTIETYLQIQASKKNNVYLTINEVGGKPILHFMNCPIKNVDAILDTEAAVA